MTTIDPSTVTITIGDSTFTAAEVDAASRIQWPLDLAAAMESFDRIYRDSSLTFICEGRLRRTRSGLWTIGGRRYRTKALARRSTRKQAKP